MARRLQIICRHARDSALEAQPVEGGNLENTPVLVGVSRLTPKEPLKPGVFPPSPLDLMERTTREAAKDTGIDEAKLLNEVTGVAIAGFFIAGLVKIYPNMPRSLANRLNIRKDAVCHQRGEGGDGAQAMTNLMADRIAKGDEGVFLCSRGLAVDTQRVFNKQNPNKEQELFTAWADDPKAGEPERSGNYTQIGAEMLGGLPGGFDSAQERLHGLNAPIHIYPLMETALRGKYGKSFQEHHASVSNIMSSFSKVAAAEKDFAWIPTYRTPEEVATANPSNRWVGYPYTKYMNANDNVDGAASWFMCSVKTAKRLGISEDKWVYLHSGAQAHEGSDGKWFVTGRTNLAQLPAMEKTITTTLQGAEVSSSQIKHFDIYSCFPCVVELSADTLGMKHDDPRGFTITGGLPFYGQMSSTHCIPSMVQMLRNDKSAMGLVTGNGGFATKHSAGLYSATAPKKPFQLPDLAKLQAEVDAVPATKIAEVPSGKATVESFTVHHNQANEPTKGVIIGRLENGERFIANTDTDAATFARMMPPNDVLGAKGRVEAGGEGKPNRFVFE